VAEPERFDLTHGRLSPVPAKVAKSSDATLHDRLPERSPFQVTNVEPGTAVWRWRKVKDVVQFPQFAP
jgi:hypothetical protein